MTGERFLRSGYIKRARLEAMLAAADPKEPSSSEHLLMAADKAQRAITDRKGRSSVARFVSVSKKIPEVEGLKDPTKTEDREWHTDKWILLKKPVGGRRMFALEIKSSDQEVKYVKESSEFKKHHPFNLVINCRPGRTHKKIINDFYSELERVAQNLRDARLKEEK